MLCMLRCNLSQFVCYCVGRTSLGPSFTLHFVFQSTLLLALSVVMNIFFCFLYRAYLVPVFSFGENELFNQVSNPRGSRLRAFQNKLMKILSFAPPLFFGRGILPSLIGIVPYRRPVCTVGKQKSQCCSKQKIYIYVRVSIRGNVHT